MKVAAFLLALALLLPVPAEAQRVLHRVRFGESLASISQHYYGSKGFANLLQQFNALPAGRPAAGDHIRIPTAWVYSVRKGTTLEAVAATFLGDRRRWPALAMLNTRAARAGRVRQGRRPRGTTFASSWT